MDIEAAAVHHLRLRQMEKAVRKAAVSDDTAGKPAIIKMVLPAGKPLSSASKPAVTPNINIINVDKRIQIMKKKAAKLHESKRKIPH